MSPYWLNNSCSPFSGPGGTCTLGNIAAYAINVNNAQDVAAGLRFSQANNIRLTIKNTGHDFLGRSAGAGSLALWTHNLKEVTYIDHYRSGNYTGPAARLGAGVQYSDLYPANTSTHRYRVLVGSCPTVGVAGGFSQGGGHSPLSAKYGLAADQVLEWEVVTADGRHLAASPSQHADLYWALRGGGGGNYGVVLSATVKAYPDGPAAGTGFAFTNEDDTTYWAAVSAFLRHLLVLDKLDGYLSGFMITAQQFYLLFALLPDAESVEDITAPLAPLFAELAALNVTVTNNRASRHPSFAGWYDAWARPLEYGTGNSMGGRLIPRTVVQDDLPALVAVLREIAEDDNGGINGVVVNVTEARVGKAAAAGASAVLPAWRDALFTLILSAPLEEDASPEVMQAAQRWLNEGQDRLREVTPGGGTYMNEATFDNENWKEDYFGANYEALRAVKAEYDPEDLLWANAAVGSDEAWEPAADGRLCRIR
jgi:FAD/FMN-containing dehydrogenase